MVSLLRFYTRNMSTGRLATSKWGSYLERYRRLH
jgi:hypothetical protein